MHDIAILGGGPGGYVAAIRGAQLGAKVALIEEDEVGGVCLNRGCIPTKAIIASVGRLRAVRTAAQYGIDVRGDIRPDIGAIISRKNKIVEALVKGIHLLLKANSIALIRGRGVLKGGGKIEVEGTGGIEAGNIIIATGSSWRSVPGLSPDGVHIVTSDDVLNLAEVPETMCIVGGGVVGCEFASIFAALGSSVTIVEAMQGILPMEGEPASSLLVRSFKKQGIKVFVGRTVKDAAFSGGMTELVLSGGEKISASKVMVSVGRSPNITGFGLETLGVKTERGAIVTDARMCTNIPGIYAIGDVNGRCMLAHKASAEGVVAAENIIGKNAAMDYGAIPRPIYTYPEICAVGMTETELKEGGVKYLTGRAVFRGMPKPVCDGELDGEVVVHAEEVSGKIVGAQVVGEHATELGAELALAVRCGLTAADVARTVHPHPTLSEILKEAADDCMGMAVHGRK